MLSANDQASRSQFSDGLLATKNESGTTRCAVSVKSDVRLSASGLDGEFVAEAWEQWRGVAGSTFDREKDYLGLATIPAATAVARDWNALVLEARGTTPDRFALRVKGTPQLSQAKIRMFESLRRTGAGAKGSKTSRAEAVIILTRLL